MKINEKCLPDDPLKLKEIILLQQQELANEIQRHTDEIAELKQKHIKENQKIISVVKQEYITDINILKKEHVTDVNVLKKEHVTDINVIKQEHITDINVLKQEHINEVTNLRHQLQKALIHRFGQRSEKYTLDQFNLFDEADLPSESAVVEIQQADEEITVAAHTRKPGGRKPLPKHLARVRVIHDLPDDSKVCACGHALHKIGEDTSEKAEFIPAQIKVTEHVRCKYACRACEGGVRMAELPKQAIPKSIAGPGLLAHVIVSKYSDHLPLYRQEKIIQRMGIDIARATLCFWVLRCAELMVPLVDLLKGMIRSGSYAQADETTVQVINEPGKANTSKSYMWVYGGGPPEKKAIVFEYQSSRSGQSAEAFLCDFQGILQTDGYSGYNGFADNKHVIQAGCWAHARRKFMDIVKTSKTPGKAHEAVLMIRKLYAVETTARDQCLNHQQRYDIRHELSLPILNDLKLWLDKTKQQVPPQSHIGKAIAYSLNQWLHLITYIHHGEVEIDNNHIENTIRPFAIGRRNWMFMGSVRGAQAGAIIYSLMATCKVHYVEPYAYFKYILDQLPRCKTNDDYLKLLPQFIDQGELMKAYSQATWV